jgi:hypothetical protein
VVPPRPHRGERTGGAAAIGPVRWLPGVEDRLARGASGLAGAGLSADTGLAIGDGALGFWAAQDEAWPETRGQRCWVHKTANVLNDLPKSIQGKAKANGMDSSSLTASRCAKVEIRTTTSPERRNPKMNATTIGLDIAKSVFQVHGVERAGKTVARKQLKRAQVLPCFANLPPAVIGLEAGAGAHYWAWELIKLGHEVRLIAPPLVTP